MIVCQDARPAWPRILVEFLRHLHYIVIHTWRTTMVANALVQARIDGKIKDEAAAVLASMGLSVSDAVRLMLTKVAHDKALPFEPLIPNAETIAAIREAAPASSRASIPSRI